MEGLTCSPSCCVGVSYLSALKARLSAGGSRSCVHCSTKAGGAEKNKRIIQDVCLTRVCGFASARLRCVCESSPSFLPRLRQIPSCLQTVFGLILKPTPAESFRLSIITLQMRPEHPNCGLKWPCVFSFLPAWFCLRPRPDQKLLSPEDSSDGARVAVMDE